MTNIVFIGTPDFSLAALKALYTDPNINISLVITGQDRRRSRNKLTPTVVKKFAIEHDLPVITPANINSDETLEKIEEVSPDFLVIVAYGQIISKKLLNKFKDRIINIHSSILPKYRGAAPINWAIVNGDQVSGVTIMLVDEGMDTGDILKISQIEIDDNERAGQLHDRLAIEGGKMIVEVLNNFETYYENRYQQDPDKASYCGKIDKSMGEINFDSSCLDIYNRFRGFYPWPGSYFFYQENMVKVHDMSYEIEEQENSPGYVKEVSSDGIKISCKDGYILLKEIQFPNKKRMDVASFLLGNEFKDKIIIEKRRD